MSVGSVESLSDGEIRGWLPLAMAGAAVEAVLEGDVVAARAVAAPSEGARATFAFVLPGHLADGRMRFIEVRLAGGEAIGGSPVLWDGGLLAPAEAVATVEGVAGLLGPATVTGWARASDGRSLEIEVLRGGQVVASAVADRMHDGAPEGPPCGFSIDLTALAVAGEAELTVRVVGQTEPLPGGVVQLGRLPSASATFRGYFDDAGYNLLASLPFEHLAVSAEPLDQRLTRFIRRLAHERGRLRAGHRPAGVLIIPPSPQAGHGDLAVRAWSLQSHPAAGQAFVQPDADTIREAAASADYAAFAWPDEAPHPSLLAVLARQDPAADVIVWDRFIADHPRAGSPGWTLRRAAFDRPTLRQGAMTDTAFAVRGSRLAEAPAPVLEAVAQGDLHPLLFWLAGADLVWRRRPEALTSARRTPAPPTAASADLCQALLVAEGSRAVITPAPPGSPAPFLLLPERRAGVISLIVMNASRAADADRTLRATAGQAVSGRIEIVLVDRPAIPGAVLDLARALFGVGNVRVVHAVEGEAHRTWADLVNVAVGEAGGEALVFVDAGAAFQDDLLLEQLALWCLEQGIGAVGCAMRDAHGRMAHGLRVSEGHPFGPPFEPETDAAFAGLVRSTPAAPLRLAAIARETFHRLGGLDAAGYGDRLAWAELMIRAGEARLTHLHLGHLTALAEAWDDADGAGEAAILRARLAMRSASADGAGMAPGLRRDRIAPLGASEGSRTDAEAALQAAAQARRAREADRADALAALDEGQGLIADGADPARLAEWARRARARLGG